jgi:hypothetical protein
VVPAGVSASGETGTAFASIPVTVPVTGVSADTDTEFGWGRGQWTQGAWGEPTGGAGQVQVGVGDIVRPTGVSAVGHVSPVTVTAEAFIPKTGVEADLNLGTVRIQADISTSVAGFQLTSALSGVTVFTDHSVVPVGVQGTTSSWAGHQFPER